jgi:nicotinamidase-related amidase
MPTAKTALLVVDVQRGILDIPDLARRERINQALDQTVGRIRELIKRARAASVPVIYVQHDGSPGHRLEPKTMGWEIRSEIAPQSGELVVHKRACDAFFETPLAAELATAGIRQLVVCGCMTQFCIDTTVRRAVSLGHDVILASDGHMTADTPTIPFEQIIEHHNALLDGFDAGKHEVRVSPSSEIFPDGLK